MRVKVTNPPIDPLREGLVMSLNMRLGARGNILQPGADAYRQISLESPVLLESDLAAIKGQDTVKTKVRAPCVHAFGNRSFAVFWHNKCMWQTSYCVVLCVCVCRPHVGCCRPRCTSL